MSLTRVRRVSIFAESMATFLVAAENTKDYCAGRVGAALMFNPELTGA